MTPPALPIFAVLPDLLAALRARSSAVLVAPPGAGKTTAVAPAMLAEPWCNGEILLLSPRRLAARAAAERMASTAGEPVGQTFGYATRMDSKRSAATRVTVITEGIFVARIQGDPELAGILEEDGGLTGEGREPLLRWVLFLASVLVTLLFGWQPTLAAVFVLLGSTFGLVGLVEADHAHLTPQAFSGGVVLGAAMVTRYSSSKNVSIRLKLVIGS